MNLIEEGAKKAKAGKVLPPGAAQQLATAPQPGTAMVPVAGTRTVNPDPAGRAPRIVGGVANPVPPAAPAGPLPNYRTGAPAGQPQFQQTPTPVNPTIRPTAAQQLGGAPAPAAPAVRPNILSRAAASLRGPGGKMMGPVAPIVAGTLLEGSKVIDTIQDPAKSKMDVVEAAARGTARTVLGTAGAIAGSRGGTPGAIAGGAAGYTAADRVIDAGTGDRYGPYAKKFQETFDSNPLVQALTRVALPITNIPGVAGMYGALLDDKEPQKPAAPVAPAATPLVNVATGPLDTSKVIGTFNGRNITQAEADQLAGKLTVANPQPSAAAQLGATINGPDYASAGERNALIRQIDQTIKGLGSLNMRGKRDLAGQLLGIKASLNNNANSLSSQQAIEQAQLDQGSAAAQLGAQTQLEAARIGAGARQQTPIVGDDGNLYVMNGNTLTPVTGADGKPAKAPTSDKEARALYGDLIQGLVQTGATLEEIQAQAPALQQLAGIGPKKAAAKPVPAGYTPTGETTPDGRPVYKDAKGNKFTQ